MTTNFMRVLSDAEVKLLKAVGAEWLVEIVERGSIDAPRAFEIAALQVFKDNKHGPAVDALRRVVKAPERNGLYRLTPEFDALCAFNDEDEDEDPDQNAMCASCCEAAGIEHRAGCPACGKDFI